MKKIDATRGIFLASSLALIIISLLVPNSNIVSAISGAVIVPLLILIDIKAPSIVKLSEDNPKVSTFRFLNRMVICIVNICFIFATLVPIEKVDILKNDVFVIGTVSIFMMIFGNLAPKIPFNRYMGVRLPWTIRDEQTWRIAHRVAGYTSFPIALGMFTLSFFFNSDIIGPIGILTWVMIPSVYSFIFYYKKVKGIS